MRLIKIAAHAVASLVAVFGMASAFGATDYPSKPVTLVVGYVPGGPADTFARKLAQSLGTLWHQSVIVENRPGATATIADSYVAHSRADGYTLMVSANDYVISPFFYHHLPYKPDDLTPVGLFAVAPNIVVVSQTSPIKDVPGFLNWVKNSKGLTYASTGVGSTSNLAGELFKQLEGVQIEHIPYKGVGEWLPDFLSGRISMAFPSLPSVTALIASGKIRVIGVAQSTRSPLLPDVPTFTSYGVKGYDIQTWWGLMAPKGTPPEVIRKINQDLNKVLASPDIKKSWSLLGSSPAPGSPEDFGRLIHHDFSVFGPLVKKINVQASAS